MKTSLAWKIALCIILIVLASVLGTRKNVLLKEPFDIGGEVVDPTYNVFKNDDRELEQPLCNIFTCKKKTPIDVSPPPRPYFPQPAPQSVVSQPAPVCPAEVTLEDLNAYDLYTPEEQAIDEKISSKQAELYQLDKQMEQSLAAYKQQEQATTAAIDQLNSAMNDMRVAEIRAQNSNKVSEDPVQKMLAHISERITKIEDKLNK